MKAVLSSLFYLKKENIGSDASFFEWLLLIANYDDILLMHESNQNKQELIFQFSPLVFVIKAQLRDLVTSLITSQKS